MEKITIYNGDKIITLDYLNQLGPILGLGSTTNRFTGNEDQNVGKGPKITNCSVEMSNSRPVLFRNDCVCECHLKVRQNTGEDDKQHNKQKVEKLFHKMNQNLENQRNNVMEGMTPSQQQVILNISMI